jgi:excisionase family DNA binding protein
MTALVVPPRYPVQRCEFDLRESALRPASTGQPCLEGRVDDLLDTEARSWIRRLVSEPRIAREPRHLAGSQILTLRDCSAKVSFAFAKNLPFRSTLSWQANWISLGQSNNNAHKTDISSLKIRPMLVSVAKASVLPGCSRNHIYRPIERRELPAVQLAIGRSLTRIRVADIEAFIDACTF